MTDSVLSALLPQLNQPFDRTLLLVIADRADEVEEGSGEGWRVLWKYGCSPTKFFQQCCYWAGNRSKFSKEYLGVNILPEVWFDLIHCHRDYFFLSPAGDRSNIADFSSFTLAYQVAAAEWLRLTKAKKQQALEELK